ncbi:MAG TPA: isoprenylcysteine carboxylmethyltransferase family protein [Methylocystis sp.]|nr:isoprenylcysteine carboxylmethyltransferase family protein [Methylocystis sp.]
MPQETDRADIAFLPPFIPVAAIFLGLALHFLRPVEFLPGDGASGFGWLLLATAFAIAGAAAYEMKRARTHVDARKPSTRIVTSGPYAFSRNPIYLAMALAVVAVAGVFNSLWVLLLAAPTALVLRIIAIEPEERYLERKFGGEYLAYKARVRRWF